MVVGGVGGGGAAWPGCGGGTRGGAVQSASVKSRPSATLAPSSRKKFDVTPAAAICSDSAFSPETTVRNGKTPVMPSSKLAERRTSSKSGGENGKFNTPRFLSSPHRIASRAGSG